MKSISGGGWKLSLAHPPQQLPPHCLHFEARQPLQDYSATMAPASDSMNDGSGTSLRADYATPTTTKTFSYPLPPASNTSTKEKTYYLSELRKSVVKLQEEVNGFLTTKMEEDKALAASAGMRADDQAEEENYGEEKVEDGS